jgi:hypothetical protein
MTCTFNKHFREDVPENVWTENHGKWRKLRLCLVFSKFSALTFAQYIFYFADMSYFLQIFFFGLSAVRRRSFTRGHALLQIIDRTCLTCCTFVRSPTTTTTIKNIFLENHQSSPFFWSHSFAFRMLILLLWLVACLI